MQPTPRYMPIDAFTAWSGIGRTRLYDLLGAGAFRAIKAGRRTLIDVQSATEWLEKQPTARIGAQGRAA